eukprot:COSAG04_NODE_1466_length_6601_cov_4.336973_1_plen_188_part_10
MGRLLGLLLTAVAAAAAKPLAPRPAASLWPAEPTADAVRSLHEMLPHDEEMSKEEMAASFERFLRARGGRFEPIWANHSHAERTANLQEHHANRRLARRRRRMQAMMGTNLFADATADEKDSSLVAALGPPASTCDDPLATNNGQQTPCAYECADLQLEYFPEPQSQSTRCFHDAATTETWPEVGGQG